MSEATKNTTNYVTIEPMAILTSLMIMSGSTGVILGARLLVLLRRFTRSDISPPPSSLKELPTVSVCIPARNETHAMTQCLERVIASTYQKLEVIVLDDASADNTSILIKSFAHAGVRFVEGGELPDGWLGKNYAQHELYKQSSGEYILYLDVDTHIAPHTVDSLISLALTENASVVSVLPTRDDAWRNSILFATLRHFWAILSHTVRHPAATSNAWLVQKDFLDDNFNGLDHLKTVAAPERSVATFASRQRQYRFFVSTKEIGVSYEKKWLSQCQTSIRLLYPFFGGKPIRVLAGLATLLLLLTPFAVLVTALFTSWYTVHSLALAVSILLVSVYMIYTARVWRSGWLVGGIIFPLILAQECCLLIASMYAYATGSVTWKGRPIRYTAKEAAN